MTEPFIGEIRLLPFNFAPRGWADCNGQLLSIAQNTALFSILGTTYGGNGQTNFALPNFQGTAPMSSGQGPGLTPRTLGEVGGSQTVTLLSNQVPAHPHNVAVAANAPGATAKDTPADNTVFGGAHSKTQTKAYVTLAAPIPTQVAMSPAAVLPNGGSQPHNNMPPYLTLRFCIAINGIFPSRG
jgi:microcystin-dependent protein